MKKDWLGILVNHSLMEGIRKRDTGHENLNFYQQAAEKYGFIPCYFRLQDISISEKKVKAYVSHHGTWKRVYVPLPKVIHNRAIFHSKEIVNKLNGLEEMGIKLFNYWNRYSKLYISQLLNEEIEFQPYLPVTYPFSLKNLKKCSQHMESFLLKPDLGTVGQGIIKVESQEPIHWEIKYKRDKKLSADIISDWHLFRKLSSMIGKEKYLIQETIKLATYQGSPFDIRVSVQKGGDGEWSLTGMVGKVARSGHFLSNVAQGGKVYRLEELLEHLPLINEEKVHLLKEIALSMARYLGQRLPHLADVGFDFGMDVNGHPYFIEMNGRDQRYSFAKGNMPDIWKKTYEKPIAYARYLISGKQAGKDSTENWNPTRSSSICWQRPTVQLKGRKYVEGMV